MSEIYNVHTFTRHDYVWDIHVHLDNGGHVPSILQCQLQIIIVRIGYGFNNRLVIAFENLRSNGSTVFAGKLTHPAIALLPEQRYINVLLRLQ